MRKVFAELCERNPRRGAALKTASRVENRMVTHPTCESHTTRASVALPTMRISEMAAAPGLPRTRVAPASADRGRRGKNRP
jgi:hypothetical protein